MMRLLFLLVICASTLPAWATNQIQGLRVWPSPANTRLVFDLADAPQYSYFRLKNPERLVIDFADTRRDIDFSQFANTSKLIKKVRHSTPKKKGSARVVIELKQRAKAVIFSLPPTAPYSNRLVVDFDKGQGQSPRLVDDQQTNGQRDIIIAIDAGHGGEDPGSIGPAGTYEKTITLSIAKLLARRINQEKGLRAVLTRDADYYLGVNERPEIARKNKADLFVSIHADAFTTPQPRGASVWVLSMKRANSELGRWMERSERHSELLGGAAEVIRDTENERYLAQVFLDMSMDHSMATSYDLSKKVLKQLKGITRLHKKSPQMASLGVLTAPDIPSILVETGFISNPQEEKNLNWGKFRNKLANALFLSIQSYFQSAPPDGTLWAQQRSSNRTHKVRSGESLSLLAQRYNVPVRELKKANNLRSDLVKIGQVLTIPSS